MIRLLLFLLTFLSLSHSSGERVFHYCVSIEVLSPAGGPTVPPKDLVGYVSPRGIEPDPPKICTWILFERREGEYYLPTVVVWSNSTDGYHVDVFSDQRFIYGHRKDKPLDFSLRGLQDRIEDMEVFLKNVAGKDVIIRALETFLEGKEKESFEKLIEVVLPPSPAELPLTFSYESRHYVIPSKILPRLKVRYHLYTIYLKDRLPPHIRDLVRIGKRRSLPHTDSWKPVKIHADLVDKLKGGG